MRKRSLLLTLFLWLIACQNSPEMITMPPAVEVTRLVTVAIPVEVTRNVLIEVTSAPQSTLPPVEKPIRLVFSPLYDRNVTKRRAEALQKTWQENSDLTFELLFPATNPEAVAEACADNTDTIAFLSGFEYVLAHEQCGLIVRYAGLREGLTWYTTMLLGSPQGSFAALADLQGKSWGVAKKTDLGNLYFQALFKSKKVTPSSVKEFESEASAMLAIDENQVDFVTAFYLPPILPYDERAWQYGVDSPDLWRATGSLPYRSGIGFAVVIDYVEKGGYELRDARASVLDSRENIFVNTEIWKLSPQFPHGAIAYGAEMSLSRAEKLDSVLASLNIDDSCRNSLCSTDFFNWEGTAPITDSFYEPFRFIRQQLAWNQEMTYQYLQETQADNR